MQTIERVMILALIREMRAAGYQPAAFHDGEDYQMPVKAKRGAPADATMSSVPGRHVPAHIARVMTDAEALAAIDTVAQGTLHFTHRDSTDWGARGVMIILGNGIDCLSDWHCPHDKSEPFGDIPYKIADAAENGTLAVNPTDLVDALRAIVREVEGGGAVSWPAHPLLDKARAALAPYGA